ncbi:hypothetical protein PCASD_16229 [Puccinia coronata f. sp. avenae]|uniref:Helicase ATP-binding domain-containing protein n=1 Tax=Puccinia coronata f. sp. avenae TaxID=200324 RepID=A0A2N5TBH9_9BASI|nr:hypothetical protein PCASD_16229 [Puccinia coronata f. sp. avenae]
MKGPSIKPSSLSRPISSASWSLSSFLLSFRIAFQASYPIETSAFTAIIPPGQACFLRLHQQSQFKRCVESAVECWTSPLSRRHPISICLLPHGKTGTGKTLAFLIPAIESRLRDLENEKIRFKTHNREATHQSFMNHMSNSAFDYSSEELPKPPNFVNSSLFERGRRDIVVATPGRLTDVLNTIPAVGQNLATAKTLIMDEAATLLEMGFKEEIDDIVRQLPAKEERSTYLFSATISPKIHRIAQQTMKKDTKIVDCVPSGETNVHAHVPQYCAYRPP